MEYYIFEIEYIFLSIYIYFIDMYKITFETYGASSNII